MANLPTIDNSELNQIEHLREQFRSGEIGMDEYIEQYPENAKANHQKVWSEIYEAHSQIPQIKNNSLRWQRIVAELREKLTCQER